MMKSAYAGFFAEIFFLKFIIDYLIPYYILFFSYHMDAFIQSCNCPKYSCIDTSDLYN